MAASTTASEKSKNVISQTHDHLAMKHLFTQCLIQLLKTSSLPCYLRRREEEQKQET
jgi:hypothetical protein